MNQSFELLSSMSPKINKNAKPVQKAPTMLALKKYFRKSSKFDKPANKTIITLDSSTESKDDQKPDYKLLNQTPVVISDSEFTDVESELRECDLKKLEQNVPNRSQAKFSEINKWVTEVNSNRQSEFSEVSTISGDSGNPGFKQPHTRIAINSTLADPTSPRFDQLFKKKKGVIIEDSFSGEISGSSSEIVPKSSQETFKGFAKNIVTSKTKQIEDVRSPSESFGDSMRIHSVTVRKKRNEIVLQSSNESLGKFNQNNNVTTKQNVKVKGSSINLTSSIPSFPLEDSEELSSDKSLKTRIQQSSNCKENVIIDDSFVQKTNSSTPTINRSCREEDDLPKEDLTGNDENHTAVETFLDDLYGNNWRQNRHLVIPSSESRLGTSKATVEIKPATERRPKKSITYKNPYLESESSKSKSLLKALQASRTNSFVESPLLKNLKNLCDSDTESDVDCDVPRIRLNFDKDVNDTGKNDGNDSFSGECSPRIKKNSNKTQASDVDYKKLVNSEDVKPNRKAKPRVLKVLSSSSDSDDWTPIKTDSEKTAAATSIREDGTYSFLASLSGNVPISKCDMSARIFRNNFKAYRTELTAKLFKLYNEKIFENALPADTPLEWNGRMRGTAGKCVCKRITRRTGDVERQVKIELSTKVLDSADRLRDTLVHELCHAVTWIVNQVADGHGSFWKSWATRAMKTFPELPPIKRCHEYVLNTKYTFRCTSCGYCVGRHTKSLDVERKRCGFCMGKFEILINKTTKKGETKSVPATPKRAATGFALFVKQNYSSCKKPDLKHGDVMKMLSEKFATLKVRN